MQPQGHVQVIVNTVDYHMNPQECLDAPRFQWVGEKKVQLEREVPAHIAQKLADMGHQVEIVNSNLGMGRGQIIWRMTTAPWWAVRSPGPTARLQPGKKYDMITMIRRPRTDFGARRASVITSITFKKEDTTCCATY